MEEITNCNHFINESDDNDDNDENDENDIINIIDGSKQLSDEFLKDERDKKIGKGISNINDFNLYKANNLFNNNNLILTQNLSNSKDFITKQLTSILKDINDYKNSGKVDYERELYLINRFGVLFKNMLTKTEANWQKELNSELKINTFNPSKYNVFNCDYIIKITIITIKNIIFRRIKSIYF